MAIHIASPELARRIRRMDPSAQGVVGFSDNLLIGPSSADLAHHAELRYRYWRGMQGAARNLRSIYGKLGESLSSADEAIIWSSGSLQHAALLWMICAILGDRPAAAVRVISFAGVGQLPNDQFGCVECELRSDRVRGLLGSGEELGTGARRAAARNWRAFTGRRVTDFNERCHEPRLGLERMGKYHAGFFPRVTGRGLRMSLFDEILLTCVGSTWSLPSEILLRRSPEGMTLRSWLACAGDVFVARRLQQWARHNTGGSGLDSEEIGEIGDRLLTGVRYRLSTRGRELLENGIRGLDDAPACSIGGGTAYDPGMPVMAAGDGSWKLVRH